MNVSMVLLYPGHGSDVSTVHAYARSLCKHYMRVCLRTRKKIMITDHEKIANMQYLQGSRKDQHTHSHTKSCEWITLGDA